MLNVKRKNIAIKSIIYRCLHARQNGLLHLLNCIYIGYLRVEIMMQHKSVIKQMRNAICSSDATEIEKLVRNKIKTKSLIINV